MKPAVFEQSPEDDKCERVSHMLDRWPWGTLPHSTARTTLKPPLWREPRHCAEEELPQFHAGANRCCFARHEGEPSEFRKELQR